MKAFLLTAAALLVDAAPPGSGWNQVWSEEFNGNSVNTNKWKVTSSNVYKSEANIVKDGKLTIKNTYNKGGVPNGGWIQSKDTFSGNNKYGYYEARIRINGWVKGKVWPTFWIWGGNWRNGGPAPAATEFDLMEYSGYAARYHDNHATTSHHYRAKKSIGGTSHTTTSAANAAQRNAFSWHVWGMYWSPTEVSFYYDGKKYMTSAQPGDAAQETVPMYIILSSSPHTAGVKDCNSGNGGYQPDAPNGFQANAGDSLPSFEIDWVRVHRGGSTPPSPPSTPSSPPSSSSPSPASSGLPKVNSVIALRKTGGDKRYVTAEKYNTNDLIARGSSVQAWEKFRVESHPHGGFALKALSNNKYIQVDGQNTVTPVRAKGNSKGTWERFTLKNMGSGRVAFQSVFNKKWLQASHNQNSAVLYGKGAQAGSWETFEWRQA